MFDIRAFKGPVILIAIFALAAFIRLINFGNRVVFGPEQAMSLIVSGSYITEKLSLLGQMYFRESSAGHSLFSGAIFNYLLVPIMFFLRYNPIYITFVFTLINLFTGFALYRAFSKLVDKRVAIFALIYFLFDATMINHSLFIWNYNLLPLVFVGCLWSLVKAKKGDFHWVLVLGLFCGLGINIQYLFALPAFVFFGYLLFRFRSFLVSCIFMFGVVLGNFTIVLFDLRHNFYHLQTTIEYLKDVYKGEQGFTFQYYHFIYLVPLVAVAFGMVTNKVWLKNKLLATSLVIVFLVFNLLSIDFTKAQGMPKDLSTQDVLKASFIISQFVADETFNVVETYDFDARAHVLRYPLIYMHDKVNLLSIKDYEVSPSIFVLSPLNYDYNNPTAWEMKVYQPFDVRLVQAVNANWGVFRLTKMQ